MIDFDEVLDSNVGKIKRIPTLGSRFKCRGNCALYQNGCIVDDVFPEIKIPCYTNTQGLTYGYHYIKVEEKE